MRTHGITPSEIVDPRAFEYVTHSRNHPELVGKRFYEVAEASAGHSTGRECHTHPVLRGIAHIPELD